MSVVLRHIALASLPLLFGLAAGWGFAHNQEACSRLVGFLFAAKCRGVQLQYQMAFQTWGTAAGCLAAALIGTWLELRRRRIVQSDVSNPGAPS
jgi:hypothetical protein